MVVHRPKLEILTPQQVEAVLRGAELLAAGELVAFPTETVYGLGAAADNPAAVAKIFLAKGRPADHPLIVHLQNGGELDSWGSEISAAARLLAAAFWPGPLTLIVKRSARALDCVTGGLSTVGLRVPSHPLAQALLVQFGGAIAAPSANRFGHVSPTCAAHVRSEFGDRLPLVLDGGECEVGLESTIVDCSGEQPVLLRPGGITPQQIEEVLGKPLGDAHLNHTPCSGRLASHYAPEAQVELVLPQDLEQRLHRLQFQPAMSLAILSIEPPETEVPYHWIALSTDPVICARDLYAALREVDAGGHSLALVSYPASEGIGLAIADRLHKAAGPRDGQRGFILGHSNTLPKTT